MNLTNPISLDGKNICLYKFSARVKRNQSDQGKYSRFIALNYPDDNGDWDETLAWAEAENRKPTDFNVAAVVAKQSGLHALIKVNGIIFLVPTIKCFGKHDQAFFLYLGGVRQDAYLDKLKSFGGTKDWFLFHE